MVHQCTELLATDSRRGVGYSTRQANVMAGVAGVSVRGPVGGCLVNKESNHIRATPVGWQGRAGQGRAGQGRAGQGRAESLPTTGTNSPAVSVCLIAQPHQRCS